MSMEDLNANKLSEEEMDDVAGGAQGARAYIYTVKKGDCLSVIAQKLGIRNWQRLVDWNVAKYPSLRKNPDYIQAGWVLKYYK